MARNTLSAPPLPPLSDPGNGKPKTEASRSIGRRPGLPSGRAMVGALLIAAAMVGAVALSRSAATPETAPVVVAAQAISPFDDLGPHNLRVVDLALPDEVLASTYAVASDLAGTVSRSYVAPGEILNAGDVVEATAAQRAAAPAREISLRIDNARAVDGRLESGDRVDVLATYGSGVDALTFVVLADVPVLSVASVDTRMGSSDSVVLTLALEERRATVALAHAADNADLTIVRTTTASSSSPDSDMLAPFRPVAEEAEQE